jgi:hypothetical protein
VAIRSLRPYESEDAFLDEERDTLTRTAVTLIGAPSRPRGVIIRFELTLKDGTALLRGEGRVLSFQPPDEHGPSSLTLRFTRLDAKSKALVDRAAALRESAYPPRPSEFSGAIVNPDTEPPPEDPLATTTMSATMPPDIDQPPPSDGPISIAISSGSLPFENVEDIGATISMRGDSELPPASTSPVGRDNLLDRLRIRAKTLSPSQVARILAVPRPTSS